ncbi:hypothetical protein B0H10DRAFT_2236119 [Mycena sp. CBHHK59/15]|nr:hypothetical protein B0H10DRAFT_2236119 [Mycena sp. CBHHK59/15]
MGVPGLWKELAPASKIRSLTELAVVEGFEANPAGCRGFRIGIDASIWFFHAAYGKEGENPELRTMFFRCATLTHAPFLPLFVFDGPRRPNVKRGKNINRELHKLTSGMKEIVESFGFEWRVAPGEAEAELAYLNRIGTLDGILSDDVDNFLFGATMVIRNPSNNLSGNRAKPVLNSDGRDDKNHTRVYRMQDITEHPEVSLTRGDMIFIGLCSGGDYDTSGMTGCGPGIAKGLVRYGFGRSLYEAAKNLTRDQLPAFLHNWRNEIRHELRTDSKGFIGSKRRALASSLPDAFPDIDILLSYVNPLTSESAGRASDNLKLTWSKEPDLGKLAATCEFYFEWGTRDAMIYRFKTVIWPGVVLRILRRGVLDLEEKRRRRENVPSTPTKSGKPGAEGTPSKLITKHFSSLTLNPVDDDDDDRLITKITRTRRHASTDDILEYRLEVRPRQLVMLAESGIKGIRRPPDVDVWAGLTESGNEGAQEKKDLTEEERRAMEEKEILVWMPASMVRMAELRIVEEFEKLEEAKRLKKAGKGTKRSPARRKAKADASEEEELLDAPRTKPRKKPVRKAKTVAPVEEEEESGSDTLPTIKYPPTKAKVKATPFPTLDSFSSEDEDELPAPKPSGKVKPPAERKPNDPVVDARTADPFQAIPSESEPPPARSRPPVPIVKDLTKGKSKAVAGAPADLKNFFPLAKAIARAKTNVQPASAPLTSTNSAAQFVSSDKDKDSPTTDAALSAPNAGRKQSPSVTGAEGHLPSIPGPSRRPPARRLPECRESEESSDDEVQPPSKAKPTINPAAPKYVQYSDTENEYAPSKTSLRPFPLCLEEMSPSRPKHTHQKPARPPILNPVSPVSRNLPVNLPATLLPRRNNQSLAHSPLHHSAPTLRPLDHLLLANSLSSTSPATPMCLPRQS